MAYQSVKKAAEDLERRAKILAERTYQKERYSHLPVAEMNAWYKKTFDRYRHAGDMWTKAGNPKKANEMYKGAIKFAPSEKVKEKLDEKIRDLYPKRRGLERNLFAAISIITFLASLFFISANLTGNSIGILSGNNLSWLGVGLFLFGLISFVFFKTRKK